MTDRLSWKSFLNQHEWRIFALTEARWFWQLIDLLQLEFLVHGYGFFCNRDTLLEAFQRGQIYIQQMLDCQEEEDEAYTISEAGPWLAYQEYAPIDTRECLIFPSFCVFKDNEMDMIWTHEPWRGYGAATRFVKYFQPKSVVALEAAVPFWNKMNVNVSSVLTKILCDSTGQLHPAQRYPTIVKIISKGGYIYKEDRSTASTSSPTTPKSTTSIKTSKKRKRIDHKQVIVPSHKKMHL